MAFTDPETGQLVNSIKKVRYTHDAMIDCIIAEPSVQQNQLAVMFDRTPAWISTIISSDAFQARLAERRGELIDPGLLVTINERFAAIATESLARLHERIATPIQVVSDDFMLKIAEFSTRGLGYGARAAGSDSNVNVAVVVQVPPKIPDAQEWAARYAPTPLVEVVK